MPDLLLFLLSTAGLVRLVTHSDLLAPLRDLWDTHAAPELPAMLARGPHCPQCVGAWAGLAVAPLTLGSDPAVLVAAWLAGALTGSLAAYLFAILDRLSR